jgi:hypothetical protein
MAGSLTSRAGVRLFAAALLLGGVAHLQAEDGGNRLKEWMSLSQGTSGLVFIIDAKITSFELVNDKKKPVAGVKWIPDLQFVRQFRLPPGRYDIVLPAPSTNIGVLAKNGVLTYIRLTAVSLPGVGTELVPGIQVVTSWGPPPADVIQRLEKAYLSGHPEVYKTDFIRDPGSILLVATEPPWPIPPPPPKT